MANNAFKVRTGIVVADTVLVSNGINVGIQCSSPTVALDVNSNDAVMLPSGTTAQRPVSPIAGMVRYNTTDSGFEIYLTGWEQLISNSAQMKVYDSSNTQVFP